MSADDRNQASHGDADLLAAYADGGLSGAERARVESLLETDAGARAELAALRQVINATRAAQPRPSAEPAWDEMAAAIRAACERQAPTRSPGLTARIGAWARRLLRPRFAAPVVAVAAAVVLFAVWSGSSDRDPARRDAPTVAQQPAPTTPDDTVPGVMLRASEVEDLDSAELDALLATLGPASMDPDDDEAAREAVDDVTLPDDVVAEWVLAEAAPVSEPAETDLFGVPDYGTLLDELSEEEIDALDAFLAAQTG
jgi:anti-sigma factor RsiW